MKKKKRENFNTVYASFFNRKVNYGILTFFKINMSINLSKGKYRSDNKLMSFA